MEQDLKSTQISKEAIDSLASKRIFFGHMSVGYNILNGVEKIVGTDGKFSTLKIIELSENNRISGPGIYHAKNGKNSYPDTKCEAFKNILLKNDFGKNLDIAFFKFCYVDIKDNSNVQSIFDNYAATIEEIKRELPELQIIHVTIPLRTHVWGIKQKIKRILKADIANINRYKFNQLLIAKYSESEAIYDLARIESTLPDGSRSSFKHKGDVYYSLFDKYTYDGGHLNELGSFLAGQELLRILADVSTKTTSE